MNEVTQVVLESLQNHTTKYLKETFLMNFKTTITETKTLPIKPHTCFIGISKPFVGYIYLSFDEDILEEIYNKNTKGMDVKKSEIPFYKNETVSEILNLVIGYATADLAYEGDSVEISEPRIVTESTTFDVSNEEAGLLKFTSPKGNAYIYFCAEYPSEIYNDETVPLRIMIVDDSLITIKKISMTVKELGHEVAGTCNDGYCAVAKYGIINPDIVTMDITMPDKNGIIATKEIMAKYKDANIIMLTSHGQEKMVLDAIKAGAKGYVLKPVNKDKLKESINKVVEKFL